MSDLEFFRYQMMIEVWKLYCKDYTYASGQLEENLIRRGVRVKLQEVDNHLILTVTING